MLIALTSYCLMMNESPSFVSYSLPRLSLASFIACSVMAVEERQVSNDEDLPLKLPHHPPPPSFLEVTCKGSEKPRRFAAGTEAGFAVSMINRKLGNGFKPVALYIEAVKDGEEPVAFGPNSVLADYGAGWKLQAVTADVDIAGDPMAGGFRPKTTRIRASNTAGSDVVVVHKSPISFLYITKILIAFVFIFAMGTIFTLALEFLPVMISFLSSSM
ncbi:hypothetical protein SAY86_018997 [Trapa natans]|uniref:Uncharacterized protein n=1 Tax=Trapa natans TaxID=22666 RepID=A0AAN7LHB5_TRANT|nr:hypothetical protein SAY86_018997 [Trapa natans]